MAERFLMWLGFSLCHQLPERSFFAGALQVPVCARDTGIYVGFTLSMLVLFALHRRGRPSGLPPWPVWILLGVFVGAMVLDGFTSYAGLRETDNALRLITGLLAGYAIAALTLPLFNGQVWTDPGPQRVLGRPVLVVAWGATLPLAYALVWVGGPLSGPLFAWAVAGSIVFTFFSIVLVMVCLLPAFERRANRALDLLVPGGVALLVTVLVFALGSAAKSWLLGIAGA